MNKLGIILYEMRRQAIESTEQVTINSYCKSLIWKVAESKYINTTTALWFLKNT